MDSFQWQSDHPENQGMDSQKLELAWRRLEERKTRSLLVIRGDRIVFERYGEGEFAGKRHYAASLAKTLIGSLSLQLALQDGLLQLDDKASQYITRWQKSPEKAAITIRHLATHTSGLEDASEPGQSLEEMTGWKGDFWRSRDRSRGMEMGALNPFEIALNDAPVLFPPGTEVHYSNTGMAALSYAVTASLRGSSRMDEWDLQGLLRKRIMEPIGLRAEEWTMGYEGPYETDGMSLYANWGGASFTPRAVAKLARLLLREGDWEGTRLIHSKWVKSAMSGFQNGIARPAGFPRSSCPIPGLGGFTNQFGYIPELPDGTFFGLGAGHQTMLVVPSLDLIIVRMGEWLQEPAQGGDVWQDLARCLAIPIMESIRQEYGSPYPHSGKIRSIGFAPEEEIVLDGLDSDNWPTTWADNGELITSYGDGYGFEPHVEKKLSLGFARLQGTPQQIQGENIRTPSGERVGDGKRGVKASGLVMVEGMLYLLVRNAYNAQLACSADRAASWQWGFRFEISFGCPTFLNYGRNYAGAADDYVYVYSPDGSDAYESYDQLVLARVPKDRVMEREAYEFVRETDSSGRAVWTKDIDEKGGIFRYPGHCHRVEAIYHAATNRFWIVLAFNHEGGWGIFDSPNPWGPWTTVYHTGYWGLSRTHSYRFPTKWINEAGTELSLVFSGRRHRDIDYDALCVRRMRLELRP